MLDGYARGNWNLSFDNPDLALHRPSLTGQAAIQRAKQLLGGNRRGIGPVKRVVISNPRPHVKRLEYGYSDQAPQGMVRITLAKLPRKAREILAAKLAGSDL